MKKARCTAPLMNCEQYLNEMKNIQGNILEFLDNNCKEEEFFQNLKSQLSFLSSTFLNKKIILFFTLSQFYHIIILAFTINSSTKITSIIFHVT